MRRAMRRSMEDEVASARAAPAPIPVTALPVTPRIESVIAAFTADPDELPSRWELNTEIAH